MKNKGREAIINLYFPAELDIRFNIGYWTLNCKQKYISLPANDVELTPGETQRMPLNPQPFSKTF